MKLIIAGSRTIKHYSPFDIHEICCTLPEYPTEVVCGMAKGPDLLGRDFALEYNIPCVHFPADWKTLGKQAGFVRNIAMAKYADALLAFWDGESRGTRHMICEMLNRYKPVNVKWCKP